MNSEKLECAHEICECMVTSSLTDADPEEAYCSDYCQSAEDMEDIDSTCNCGHPPCDTP